MKTKPSLSFLFFTFLKIGCMAFGGFMALVAVVEKIVVEKHKLISTDDILEGISLASIMPGPTAVNVVSFVGYRMRNWAGALVCTVGILIPTFIFMIVLSYIYFTFGDTPVLEKIFIGIIPAIVAIIIAVAINLARKKMTLPLDYIMAITAAGILIFFGNFYTTLAVVIVSALAGAFIFRSLYVKKDLLENKDYSRVKEGTNSKNWLIAGGLILVFIVIVLLLDQVFPDFQLRDLLVTFSQLSVTLFGGGYVMIPMMQDVLVNDYAWVTGKEFADGIAMGQVTPGPIMISAAFIGYKLGGITGAFVATLGMFAPTAILMIIASSFLDKIGNSIHVQAATRSIKVVAVGMIFAAAILLGGDVDINWVTGLIFTGSLLAVLVLKASVLAVIPLAGIAGWLLSGFL